MPSYVPSVTYGLRLFIVVLQELTLFTTMIIVVFSLKSSYVYAMFCPISRCVRELHGIHVPIVMYSLRLFIVVLQELHCLPNI